MEQGSESWVQARLGHITASRFGDVLTKARSGGGLSKTAQGYLWELVSEHMTGRPASDVDTYAMQWGKKWEQTARDIHTNEFGSGRPSKLAPFIRHPTLSYVGGSPDSLIGDDSIGEIKCPLTARNHARVLCSGEVPEEHDEQIQGLLWITGRNVAEFSSYHPYFPKPHYMAVVRVDRNDEIVAAIEKAVTAFRVVLLESLKRLGVEPLPIRTLE